MLLALDVGNTEITAGLFHGPELSAHWRLTTATERTPDEWSVTLNALLVQAGHSPNEVRAAVMASTGAFPGGSMAGCPQDERFSPHLLCLLP